MLPVLLPEEKAVIFILLVALLGGLILAGRNWTKNFILRESESLELDINKEEAVPDSVYVIIAGSIKYPGLYRLNENQTMGEILQLAGIDSETRSVRVVMKPGSLEGWEKEIPVNERLDVNRASLEELIALPRIGPQIAQRIVAYRQVRPFRSLEELREVEGIGENLLNFLRSQLRVLPENAYLSLKEVSLQLVEERVTPRIFNISPSLNLKSLLEQTNFRYGVWVFEVSASGSILFNREKVREEKFPTPEEQSSEEQPVSEPVRISSGGNSIPEVKFSNSAEQNGLSHYDSEGRLNLNLATSEELEKLPGIGPVIAQRVLEYRNAKGSFQSVEQLKEIQGIGDKKYLRIKDLLYVVKPEY